MIPVLQRVFNATLPNTFNIPFAMNLIDSITLRHFHKTCIKIAGAGTVDALGWQNQNSQQVRFGMLAGMSDMGGCSVLDAGCGHGDL